MIEYTFDAAGNITNIQSQASSLAITSFTPTSGPEGAAVTIYGVGFSPTPGNNLVKFNGVTATVSASDASSISTTVPTGATTGRITVTVGGNTVTSAQDFTVTAAGAPTITSFTPTSGLAASSVSVTGTAFNTSATTVKLNGTTASSSVSSTTALTFTVPASTASGRITATTAAGTGSSTTDFIVPPPGVNVADIITTVRISAGGADGNVVVGTANKRAIVLFDGLINTYYSLQFGSFQTSPTSATVAYQVIKPDNTVLATGSLGNGYRPSIHLPKLTVGGTYSVMLSPGTATLNTNVRVAANPILTADGAGAATNLDAAYQSARFIFDATVNQRLGLGAVGVVFTPSSPPTSMSLSVYKPDGTLLGSPACSSANTSNPQGNCDYEFMAPVTGTYSVFTENPSTAYSNTTVQLNSNVTGTLAADVGQTVTLNRVGQDAQYSFTASSGDSFALDISATALLPQAQTIVATVLKPDGTSLTSCSAAAPANFYCELGTLTTAGSYTVLVDPAYGAYGAFKLTLKQGPLMNTSDPATAFAPADVPENARMRFAATAGQPLTLGISNLTYVGSGTGTYLSVYLPDRSNPSYVSCSPTYPGGFCKLNLLNPSVTGTYAVAIQPPPGVKVSGSLTLSSDLTGTLVSGTPQTVNMNRAGQRVRFTFSGTAGDSTSIKLYGVTTTPASQSLTVTVNKPDGSLLASSTLGNANATIVILPSLPTTGTYVVLIDSSYGNTWQGQLSLDPGTLISIDGATSTLTNSVAGEPVRYRFSGTAGQRVDFGLTGLTYAASASATGFTLYRPDATTVSTATCATTGVGACEASVASLPSTGTYSAVFVTPGTTTVTGGTFAFSTPVAGTFVVGNPAQTVPITRPGQTVRYTFSGTSAQLLRLNWSSVTVGSGATVNVTVLKPDLTTLSSGSFVNGASGGFDIASLPSTGTYTVVFDPTLAATMSASIALVTR